MSIAGSFDFDHWMLVLLKVNSDVELLDEGASMTGTSDFVLGGEASWSIILSTSFEHSAAYLFDFEVGRILII